MLHSLISFSVKFRFIFAFYMHILHKNLSEELTVVSAVLKIMLYNTFCIGE